MIVSQVIKFEGPIDSLVWKSPLEDFNTTSQLIVDETHEALLVVNGNACDLFGPGRHTLETPNIPLVKRIINIPTGGVSSFPCKVFYINKVHQMDIMWGIPGEITLNDPVYDIFLHVGMCGNMNFQVEDVRKFMLKIVGFRDVFDADSMIAKFRGIIKQYVKYYIARIMNVNKVSYFDMNENLFELSRVVKEQLDPIFKDYGVEVLQFNIETITVPDEDFEAVKKAKELRTARTIQGYTWQEERKMDIAQSFAKNEGSLGGVSAALGGMMVGGVFANKLGDVTKDIFTHGEMGNMVNSIPSPTENQVQLDEMSVKQEKPNHPQGRAKYCINCGNALTQEMVFCPQCGTKQENECPNCKTKLLPNAAFCHLCGTKVK